MFFLDRFRLCGCRLLLLPFVRDLGGCLADSVDTGKEFIGISGGYADILANLGLVGTGVLEDCPQNCKGEVFLLLGDKAVEVGSALLFFLLLLNTFTVSLLAFICILRGDDCMFFCLDGK